MATPTFGYPTLHVDASSALTLTIDSEWSSKLQQFLTLRRIPSFVETAGTRFDGRLCDVIFLGRGIDRERIESAIAEWSTALKNDRGTTLAPT
ncbi:MAG: hypothetical protein IPK07_34770 [Deltaproteobacteria bacterium]|nr:hypothetical protein [Deltaproteobacteria bacterium]